MHIKFHCLTHCVIFETSLQIGRCFVFFNIEEGYYSLWKFNANKTTSRFTWYWYFLSTSIYELVPASIWVIRWSCIGNRICLSIKGL